MFNHIAKYGDKVANTVVAGLKMGQKATGAVHKYGVKVQDFGKVASKLPGIGAEVGKAVGVAGGVAEAFGAGRSWAEVCKAIGRTTGAAVLGLGGWLVLSTLAS